MTALNIEELETNLRAILARVQAGETVIIADHGQTVAQLSPCDPRAALAQLFPSMTPAIISLRDIAIRPVPVASGVDPVAMLIEGRADRDLLS